MKSGGRVVQGAIKLHDACAHKPLARRQFLRRLADLAGGTAAVAALAPLFENAHAEIVPLNDARLETGYLNYPGATGNVRAYFAKPKGASAKRPAIVVIHENRGLNAHIEDVARRTALEGYLSLAPDLLSPLGGTPKDEDAARDAFGKLDRKQAVAELVAGVDYLAARPDVSGRIGCVGFCWGGGMANQLAVNSARLNAAAVYYGDVPSPDDVPRIKARLMLHYAGLDKRIDAGIPSYETALKAANVAYALYMYEGANHAFNNDTGKAYDKQASELAWQRTMAFFKQTLGT